LALGSYAEFQTDGGPTLNWIDTLDGRYEMHFGQALGGPAIMVIRKFDTSGDEEKYRKYNPPVVIPQTVLEMAASARETQCPACENC